ncbi:MAG: glycosyltransferase [bacterium]|nr:glycosyltransferase [bacterium]
MLSKDTFFVIVHWGSQELTQKAVLSVQAGAQADNNQIVVVENGMPSGVTSDLAKLISLPSNKGYAGGVNAGIHYALEKGAENILIMNNDLLYMAGSAEAMLAEVKKGFGCVGATVSEGQKEPTLAGGFVDWFRGRTHFVFNKQSIKKMHYVSGAFLLITKKCFLDVGDMPEVYFHTWEDVAWGFRMREKGWQLGFAETPVIPHLVSQSLSKSKLKTYYLVRNGALFVREYAPFWAKLWLIGLEPLRLLWARIRGREEIVKALRDARNNLGGRHAPATTPEVAPWATSGVVRGSVLSVIIVTHQSQNDIAACLKSVQKESVGLKTEIIVVDAGSTDDTKTVVHQSCTTAKYIQLRNVGFASAANLGASQATGDILLFLNPDAILMDGALSMLEQRFGGQNNIGIVGGFLMSAPETPEKWQAMPFPSLRNVLLSHFGRLNKTDLLFPQILYPVPCTLVPWVSGGALSIRKEDFINIGGFNERYFLYFEDVDLCRRMRDAGFGVYLDPQMRVLHQGGKSANQEQRVQAYDRSQGTYFLAHRPMWEYLALSVFRFFFRSWVELVIGLILVGIAVFGATTNHWLLISVLGIAVVAILATIKWPHVGLWLLAGSIVFGQTVRFSGGAINGTVTDFILPLVLVGLFYAVVARRRVPVLVDVVVRGWWLPVAVLPGILLAWQRLPVQDFVIAFSYCLRLFAILSLIPLVRVLRVSFSSARKTILMVAIVLVGLGFLQLLVLPSLPPQGDTFFSQLFLRYSGGGWDPHQLRLFSTWLDPNFLGMFFVMALALILGTCTAPGAEQGCSAPGAVQRFGLMLSGLVGLIIFTALALTRSRASFLALFAMLVVYFIFTKIKRIFVPVITVLVLALLLFPALSARIFVAPLADPTVQLRLQSWQQAIWHFENFPLFGMGYNAYGVEQMASGNVMNQNIHSLAGTDNFTLLVLATVGIWGVVILLFGMSRFVAGLIAGARQNQTEALSVLLVLIALFAHAQFIQSFTYIHLLLPVALLIGTNKRT